MGSKFKVSNLIKPIVIVPNPFFFYRMNIPNPMFICFFGKNFMLSPKSSLCANQETNVRSASPTAKPNSMDYIDSLNFILIVIIPNSSSSSFFKIDISNPMFIWFFCINQIFYKNLSCKVQHPVCLQSWRQVVGVQVKWQSQWIILVY